MGDAKTPASIDEYIAGFPTEIQARMQEIRRIIREEAPNATEKISWAMPTFFLNGNLVHFAAHAHHLGFYPGADGVEHFLPKLKDYKTSKGSIQMPYAKPLPEKLVREIVRFRVKQNTASKPAKAKKTKQD